MPLACDQMPFVSIEDGSVYDNYSSLRGSEDGRGNSIRVEFTRPRRSVYVGTSLATSQHSLHLSPAIRISGVLAASNWVTRQL